MAGDSIVVGLVKMLTGIDNWDSEAGSEVAGSKIAGNELDAYKVAEKKWDKNETERCTLVMELKAALAEMLGLV